MRNYRRFHNAIPVLLLFAALPGATAYAQKSSASYTYTDLGGLPGWSFVQSEPLAINDYGEIAGWSLTAGSNGSEQHGVVWAKDAAGRYVITDLWLRKYATGINNEGEIAAGTFLVRPVVVNGSLAWYQDFNGDGFNDLAIPIDGGAYAINDNMQIVSGYSVVQFDATGDEIVTTLPGEGYAINEYDETNDYVEVAGYGPTNEATIWKVNAAGQLVDTVTLAPLPGSTSSTALCIDALGRAAGYSEFPVSFGVRERATLWQSGTAPTDLGAPSRSSSAANGINTVNGVLQVVGYYNGGSGYRAFLWKNGVMKDLNSLISASGVTLTEAKAINSHGQIVGTARVTVGKNNTEEHAFLLTPK